MNKFFKSNRIAFAITMVLVTIFVFWFNWLRPVKNVNKYNLFLDPTYLWGTEDYSGCLAKAFVPENYEVVYLRDYENDCWKSVDHYNDFDDNPEFSDFMKKNPGTYTWIEWTWQSKTVQEKWAPVYGEGVWIYDPAG